MSCENAIGCPAPRDQLSPLGCDQVNLKGAAEGRDQKIEDPSEDPLGWSEQEKGPESRAVPSVFRIHVRDRAKLQRRVTIGTNAR